MLRRNYAASALCDDSTADLDVDALLQGFLRQAKANGAQLIASARVVQMTHQGSDWRLQLANGSAVEARVVVNAAGAWADELGQLAGGERLGLVPKRRSAAIVDAPTAWALERMRRAVRLFPDDWRGALSREARAIADEDLDRENAEKTSSVHFVRFELSAAARQAVRAGAQVRLGCDHTNYPAHLAIAADTLASLAGDLRD